MQKTGGYMRKTFTITIIGVLLFFASGCKKEEVVDVQILLDQDVMVVGEQQYATYQLTPDKEDNLHFTWISSKPSVVRIDQDGNCHALATGKATISIVFEGRLNLTAEKEIIVLSIPSEKESTVITENAILVTTIDQTILHDSSNRIMVTVNLTARKEFTAILSTGTFQRLGLIDVAIVNEENKEQKYYLYSELYRMAVTDDEYEFTLLEGESVTRSLSFATLPFVNIEGDETIAPPGTYQVQIRISLFGEDWQDTGLEIVVS